MRGHYWEKKKKNQQQQRDSSWGVRTESGSWCWGTGSFGIAAATCSTKTLMILLSSRNIQRQKESSSVSLLPSQSYLYASHWWNQFASRTLAAREAEEFLPFPSSRLCRKVEWKWADYTITLGGEESNIFSNTQKQKVDHPKSLLKDVW